MSNTITILPAADVAKRITRLGRVAAKVQTECHLLAVSCLGHVRDHGDTTLAVRLLDALPKGTRREGLAVWFERFSKKKLSLRAKDGKYTAVLSKDRAETDFDIEAADAVPFWDLTKEERPGKTFTVAQLLAMLKKRADDDGTLDDGSPKVDPKARDLAADLLAYVEGLNAPMKKAA